MQGFPKDIWKAVEYFEKDGSAFSLYEIAVFFRTETSIYDKETYGKYLHRAIKMGCEEALLEKILDEKFATCVSEEGNIRYSDLLAKIKKNSGLLNFIIAYFMERGIIEGNINTVFTNYYESAKDGFLPACVRIGVSNELIIDSIENLKKNFIRNEKNGKILADYCMGAILYFGYGVLPNRSRGIGLIEYAANNGNDLAIKALHCINEMNSE